MLVLGIDPGLATTGFGLIEDDSQGRFTLVSYGIIETSANTDISNRLVSLYDQVSNIILLHKPGQVAVEKLFFQKNVKTAMMVGQARGVVLLALAQHELLPAEYTPNEIKQAVCGYGSAGKQQVQLMVQALLKMTDMPKPDDAADALAVAICHLSYAHYNDAINQATG